MLKQAWSNNGWYFWFNNFFIMVWIGWMVYCCCDVFRLFWRSRDGTSNVIYLLNLYVFTPNKETQVKNQYKALLLGRKKVTFFGRKGEWRVSEMGIKLTVSSSNFLLHQNLFFRCNVILRWEWVRVLRVTIHCCICVITPNPTRQHPKNT